MAPGLGFDESRPVNIAPALYFTYRDKSRAFEDVGSWDNQQVSVTGLAEPRSSLR